MYELPNLKALGTIGSSARYVQNNFATLNFPSHWSIITGLYQESHAIIYDVKNDTKLNATFNSRNKISHKNEWYSQNAEPIWTTNQKAGEGRKSVVRWIGTSLNFKNDLILKIPYQHPEDSKKVIQYVVKMFVNKKEPVNFAAIYFDEPGKSNFF